MVRKRFTIMIHTHMWNMFSNDFNKFTKQYDNIHSFLTDLWRTYMCINVLCALIKIFITYNCVILLYIVYMWHKLKGALIWSMCGKTLNIVLSKYVLVHVTKCIYENYIRSIITAFCNMAYRLQVAKSAI